MLIGGLFHAGRHEVAEKLFDEMQAAGLLPDVFAYDVLLDGFRKTQNLDKMYGTRLQLNVYTFNIHAATFKTSSGGYLINHDLLKGSATSSWDGLEGFIC